MVRRVAALTGLLTVCLIVLTPTAGYSADWDPFPTLEGGQHVAIKRRFDGPLYNDLKRCYRHFDSRVDAEYYGAMVDVTAEDGSRSRKHSDAGPYADALFDDWKQAGKVNKDDILVVMGLRNRSIAVRPGAKWRKVGFEGKVIEDTIAASHFEKYRRRRNYVDAMCSLATAIDLRLTSLQQEMKERIAALEQRLPALDEKLSALTERVDKRFEDGHPFGDELLARLAAARTHLDDAKAGAEDTPGESVRLADKVQAVLQPVRDDLARFDREMKRLDEIEASLSELKAKIEARPDVDWEQPQAALVKLAQCETKAEEIRQTYDGHPWQVRDCRRQAELHLARADVHYFYRRTVLPALAGALLVALLIGLLVAQILRRRRALAALDPDLERWRRRLENAAERLAALGRRRPEFFAAGRPPWQGEGAQADRQVRDAVDQMTELLADGRELLGRAQRLRDKAHRLDARHLEEAGRVLRQTPVSRIGDASALLGEIDAAYVQAVEGLDEVGALVDRLAEQTARASAALTRAHEAVDQRRALGLPAEHLSEPLAAAMMSWERGHRLSPHDPARATELLEQSTARLQEIAERAELGNEAVEQVQGPLAQRGDELRQHVRKLRFARIDADKLSFAPKRQLQSAKRRATRIIESVAEAREQAAGAEVDRLRQDLERLDQQLARVERARDQVPERLDKLVSAGKDLQARLMDMRYTLRSVTKAADDEVFAHQSKLLGRYHARLNRLAKLVGEIKKEHAAGHYAVASEQVDDLESLFEAAESLLDELGDIEQALADAKTRCAKLAEAWEPRLRSLQSKTKQAGVSPGLTKLVAEQAVSFQMLLDAMNREQGNWLQTRDELEALGGVLEFLISEVDADFEAYAEAQAIAERLDADLSALQPRADWQAELLSRARQMLQGWHSQLQEGVGGGCALMRTGREVGAACARVAEAVAQNAPLGEVAVARLDFARARLEQVDGRDYGLGVHADCSHVADTYQKARAALDTGDVAGALFLAEEVIEQVDLESARADAAVEREYRQAQVQARAHEDPRISVTGAPTLDNHSSWADSVAVLDETAGTSA